MEGTRFAWSEGTYTAFRIAACILHTYTETVTPRNDPLDACTGFDWDEDNAPKNWERHRVTPEEAADVFFNEPLVVRSDGQHSSREKRHYALGQTSAGRRLFVAFTIRRALVHVISVRDMNGKESDAYGKREDETDA